MVEMLRFSLSLDFTNTALDNQQNIVIKNIKYVQRRNVWSPALGAQWLMALTGPNKGDIRYFQNHGILHKLL